MASIRRIKPPSAPKTPTSVGETAFVSAPPRPRILQPTELSPKLQELVADYQKFATSPDMLLQDPARAQGMCGYASQDFIDFLSDRLDDSIPPVQILVYNFQNKASRELYPLDVPKDAAIHAVAFVDNCAIDWSASQYVHGAPMPLIYILPNHPAYRK